MLGKTALALMLAIASPLAFAYRMPSINVREILWNIFVLCVIAVIFGLVDYAVKKAPFIDDAVKAIVHWVLIVILCAVLIFMLLDFVGL